MSPRILINDNIRELMMSVDNKLWKKMLSLKYESLDKKAEYWVLRDMVSKNESFWFRMDKINTITNKNTTINLKMGKFLAYMNEFGLIDAQSHDIEKAVSVLQSLLKSTTIQELDKTEICRVYNAKNYLYPYLNSESPKRGILSQSCMRYESCQRYLKFFDNIEDIKILVMTHNNKLIARALLWETQQGVKVMDRVYYTEQYQEVTFVTKANENGWLHYRRTATDGFELLDKDNNIIDDHFTVKLIDDAKIEYFPYLDTFKYYDSKLGRLSNKPFNTNSNLEILLNNPSGNGVITNKLDKNIILSPKDYAKLKIPGLLYTIRNISNNIDLHELNLMDIFKGRDVIHNMDIYDISIIEWENVPRKSFINISTTIKTGERLIDMLPLINPIIGKEIINRVDIFTPKDYIELLEILDKNNLSLEMMQWSNLSSNGRHIMQDAELTSKLINLLFSKYGVRKIIQLYKKELFNKKFFRALILSRIDSQYFIEELYNNTKHDTTLEFLRLYDIVPELAHYKKMYFIKKSLEFKLDSYSYEYEYRIIIDKIRNETGLIPVGTMFKFRKGIIEKIKWLFRI